MKHLKLYSAVMLVGMFILGAVTGAALMRTRILHGIQNRLARQSEPPNASVMLTALELRVQLDDAQKAQVMAILEEDQPQMVAIRREVMPRIDAIHQREWAKIRELLRPDQRGKFAAFTAELTERRGRLFSTIPTAKSR